MAFKITEDCISCGACQPECPNEAIIVGGEGYEVNGKTYPALSEDTYYIAPEKCTECVGFNDEPMCTSVCPTDSPVRDESNPESKEALLEKAKALHPDKQF